MRRAALRALSPIRQPLLWVDPGTPLTQEATAIAPFAAPLATVGELLVTNSVCLPSVCDLFGGAEGIRTPDLCDANAALFQLSYSPSCRWVAAGRAGPRFGGLRGGRCSAGLAAPRGKRRGWYQTGEPGTWGFQAGWPGPPPAAPLSARARMWRPGRCGAWRRSGRHARRRW